MDRVFPGNNLYKSDGPLRKIKALTDNVGRLYGSLRDTDRSNSVSDGVLSSEIARLVAGYLTSSGCLQTRSTFINENAVLAEFSGLVQRGILRSVDSTLDGLCLTDLINEYSV